MISMWDRKTYNCTVQNFAFYEVVAPNGTFWTFKYQDNKKWQKVGK